MGGKKEIYRDVGSFTEPFNVTECWRQLKVCHLMLAVIDNFLIMWTHQIAINMPDLDNSLIMSCQWTEFRKTTGTQQVKQIAETRVQRDLVVTSIAETSWMMNTRPDLTINFVLLWWCHQLICLQVVTMCWIMCGLLCRCPSCTGSAGRLLQ